MKPPVGDAWLGGFPHRDAHPALILAVVCLGIFVAALDQTVVYGALADVMLDIQLPITQLDEAAWIVLGYLLGYTSALPLMARVSDVYGHGRAYIYSMALFMAGSVLVALASDLRWMVGARVLQAAGGGAVVPIAMAVVGDIYGPGRRAIALGIIGAAAEAGGALGPAYGGAIAQFFGWRWIFWANLPIGLVVVVLLVVATRRRAAPGTGGRVDYLGGLILAGALVCLSVGLSGTYGLIFIPSSLGLLALFGLRQIKVPQPLVDLSMFKRPTFAAANVINLLVGGALIIAMVNVPLMSDTIMGRTPLEGGLRLLRLTVAMSLGALVGGVLCKRLGYRPPTMLGLLLAGAGFYFMSNWGVIIDDPQLSLHLAIAGLGFGVVIAPLATAVVDSVEEGQRAIASSLVLMMRMIGMIVGLSAITAWGVDRFHLMTAGMTLPDIVANPEKLTIPALSLFHDFFTAAMGVCLLALVPAFWLRLPTPGSQLEIGS